MGRRELCGIPLVAGIVSGSAWWFQAEKEVQPRVTATGQTAWQLLQEARQAAVEELRALIESRRAELAPDDLAVLEAQVLMIQDPELDRLVAEALDRGLTVEEAWEGAIEHTRKLLDALPDPYLRARAADVRDIGTRVLRRLRGVDRQPASGPGGILLAEDLTPSEVVALERSRVLGVALVAGSPTTHAAILLRNRGIPAVIGLGPALREVKDGTVVTLDGERGCVILEPTEDEVAASQERQSLLARIRAAAWEQRNEPAQTLDGIVIEVGANVGSLADAVRARENGADGIGLLRTEFLYLERETPPSEEELREQVGAILDAMGHRPVIVRTLDIGGDKPLPYVSLPQEANPFLGIRGIRLSQQQPELFRVQLRALCQLRRPGLRIMLPMVATIDEVQWARQVLNDVCRELQESSGVVKTLELGIMIEVPSAALLADHLAEVADFFSIGTNDLTQYVMAADRTHAALGTLQDPLHPAVLRLVAQVVASARQKGRWVGVCGEAASDLTAVPLLIGLGVQELSVNPDLVPDVKAEVRRWSLRMAQDVAQRALQCRDAAEVRSLVRHQREQPEESTPRQS